MLRSFHGRGLGSLGDPANRRYLGPEARMQSDRMRSYHSDDLAKAQDARKDISKLKAASKFAGPAGEPVRDFWLLEFSRCLTKASPRGSR